MLGLGYETPSILILAGLSKPLNYFETITYLKEAINELGIELKSGLAGIISYSSYFVKKIAKSDSVKQNLSLLYSYSTQKDYDKSIFNFYRLYWAWDDLEYGNDLQEYWPGATNANIEEIVIMEARQWLKKNENFFSITISYS